MSRTKRLLLSYLAICTSTAQAQESPHISLTSSTTVLYSANNRDTRPSEIETLVNDGYGAAEERLYLGFRSGRWDLSLRVDGYYYYVRNNPVDVALTAVQERRKLGPISPSEPADPEYFVQKVYEAGNELSNRTLNWAYPTKYSISYGDPDFKISVGDSYAEFGRGFVLSLRKQDELLSDTTVRGVKVSASKTWEHTRAKWTALAGTGNPLRVDSASGRYLGSGARQGIGWVTEFGMPWAVETDFAPKTSDCATTLTCSYAPDNLFGAQFALQHRGVEFGSQASVLQRPTQLSADVVRSARLLVTGSQSVELTNLLGGSTEEVDLDIYLEGVGQMRGYERESRGGYALYSEVNLALDDFNLLAELKHYRRFFPLSAGVDTRVAREFSQIQYSTPPTTEPIWTDTQFEYFNTCVSGGRVRADYQIHPELNVFSTLGRFDSWAESVSNEECETRPEYRNRVYDAATGLEYFSGSSASHHQFRIGIRDDQTPETLQAESTNIFYREAYLRFDLYFPVGASHSLELTGWHRYRHQVVGGPESPYAQGISQISFDVTPELNLAVGMEYDGDPRTPTTYFNSSLSYRLPKGSEVRLFAGQQRGAQRCVAGVCRVLPPFEGARLDLTLRHF